MLTKTKKIAITSIVTGVCAAAIWLCATQYMQYKEERTYYESRFIPGTVINEKDVSDMTVEEAESLLIPSADKMSLSVLFKDGETECISADDIEYHYSDSDGIIKILSEQKYPFIGNRTGTAHSVTIKPTYSAQKTESIINGWAEVQEENMQHPEDPTMIFEDGKFKPSEGNQGNYIDKEKLIKTVKRTIEKKDYILDAEEAGLYETKDFSKIKEDIQKEADKLNQYCAASVTYQLPSGLQTLDGNTLKDWLTKDEKGNYKKDEAVWAENIAKYVNETADKLDNIGSDRIFKATGIGEVIVSGGTYGYLTDREAEIAKLTEELESGTVTERLPECIAWETSFENNGFGTSYVEIDLTRQHLWTYVNGVMVLETDIISGLPTPDRYTPQGVYLVYAKESPSILVGEKDETGQPEYRTPVSYWMPFNEGIGMHDATWQWAFGGDSWYTNGSHGCINMPLEAAAAMYDIVTYDMPIVCYYSGGSPF